MKRSQRQMIDSFSLDKQQKILYPGIVVYENILDITENDISDIYDTYKHLFEYEEYYELSKVKNTFLYGLNKINKKNLAEKIQKTILSCFARYCDLYEEAIHTIQWQENIFIDVDYAGSQNYTFNPNRSFTENDKIKNTPFSRQVCVEVIIDDDYIGGSVEWPYLNNLKIDKIPKGSIIFYPSNYLFSKKHDTIMSGRKIVLTTFFNGGKDFLSEENGLEDEGPNLLSSYMR